MLTGFTNLSLPHAFKKNDKVILNYLLKQNISINETLVYDTKQIYLQLDNTLKFTFKRIKEIEDFFIEKINYREKLNQTLLKRALE